MFIHFYTDYALFIDYYITLHTYCLCLWLRQRKLIFMATLNPEWSISLGESLIYNCVKIIFKQTRNWNGQTELQILTINRLLSGSCFAPITNWIQERLRQNKMTTEWKNKTESLATKTFQGCFFRQWHFFDGFFPAPLIVLYWHALESERTLLLQM